MRAPPPSLHYRENCARAPRHPGRLLRDKMAVESRVTQEEIKKEPEKPIDREKTCPLLLRVFTTNNGRHHRMDEFSRGNVPSSELQIYTWMDATLKELTSLVKEVYPEARKKGTHFNFAIVFTDLKRPGYRHDVFNAGPTPEEDSWKAVDWKIQAAESSYHYHEAGDDPKAGN
uniref:Histone deacetylase complex subunit SAP18 n=1 Tax=Gallus gallus TaxID=9031 RepID=A0A8V0XRN1_CHICK